MSGIRVGKQPGYTVVLNGLLPADGSLSARAWGIYVYLIGRPPGWVCNSKHLSTVFKEGREAILTALHELVAAGLMVEESYREGNLRRKRFAIPDVEVEMSTLSRVGFSDSGEARRTKERTTKTPPSTGGSDKYAGRARTPLRQHLRHIPKK